RLPAHLEEEALLGIELGRLARRDAEELGVEAVHGVEEPRPAQRRQLAQIERARGPAILRDLADRVPAAGEQAPVRVEIVGPAGEPAGQADHGDRLALRRPEPEVLGPEREVLGPELLDRGRGALEQLARGVRRARGGVGHRSGARYSHLTRFHGKPPRCGSSRILENTLSWGDLLSEELGSRSRYRTVRA